MNLPIDVRKFYILFVTLGVTGLSILLTAALAVEQKSEVAQQRSRLGEQKTGFPPLPMIEDPVASAESLRRTYEFVGERSEISRFIPCFCTCGKKRGHRSIEDCYVKARGQSPDSIVWNDHAGECYICVEVADEARRLYLEGRGVREIRASIEQTFGSKLPNRTKTPEPPVSGQENRQ